MIEFVGRKDSQVKVRGYRIELAEIEGALISFDNVKEVCVLVLDDQRKEKRIVAYVVLGQKVLFYYIVFLLHFLFIKKFF